MSIRRFFGKVPRKELAHGFLGNAKVFGELRRRQTEGVQLSYFVALRVELEAAGAAFAPAAMRPSRRARCKPSRVRARVNSTSIMEAIAKAAA